MLAKSQINIVKMKVIKYPSLAYLVKRILCQRATNVSHGGIVVRPHRSSLAPQRLHKILFLKCNECVFDALQLL